MSASIIRSEGSAFTRFMASGRGRLARVTRGVAIADTSLVVIGGDARFLIAAVGLVPMTAGAFNLCLIAPLWGGHFFGSNYCVPKSGAER